MAKVSPTVISNVAAGLANSNAANAPSVLGLPAALASLRGPNGAYDPALLAAAAGIAQSQQMAAMLSSQSQTPQLAGQSESFLSCERGSSFVLRLKSFLSSPLSLSLRTKSRRKWNLKSSNHSNTIIFISIQSFLKSRFFKHSSWKLCRFESFFRFRWDWDWW